MTFATLGRQAGISMTKEEIKEAVGSIPMNMRGQITPELYKNWLWEQVPLHLTPRTSSPSSLPSLPSLSHPLLGASLAPPYLGPRDVPEPSRGREEGVGQLYWQG